MIRCLSFSLELSTWQRETSRIPDPDNSGAPGGPCGGCLRVKWARRLAEGTEAQPNDEGKHNETTAMIRMVESWERLRPKVNECKSDGIWSTVRSSLTRSSSPAA